MLASILSIHAKIDFKEKVLQRLFGRGRGGEKFREREREKGRVGEKERRREKERNFIQYLTQKLFVCNRFDDF